MVRRTQTRHQEEARRKKQEEDRRALVDATKQLADAKEQLKALGADKTQLEQTLKMSDVDEGVALYRALRSQGIAGPEVPRRWRGWQSALQYFQAQPPSDPWASAGCDSVLELEQQLEQEQAHVHVSPCHLDARDRLRDALASKVASLIQFDASNELSHLQCWSSLLNEHAGDLAAAATGESDVAELVHNALQEVQHWEQECSTHLSNVYQASDEACSEVAVVLRDLASALLGGPSCTADLLIRPKLANFRESLDREVEARKNALSLLESWPKESVVEALRAIRASVDTAFARSLSMTTMQERLAALLPALQAQRPDTDQIKIFDAQLKKLKRNSEALALKARHCNEDGEVEDAKQAEDELQHTRVELTRVVRERHQRLTSALALAGQFPELLLPDSKYFCQSLKQILESHGLEMGFQSFSLFSDRQVIANQDTRHTVYKARLDGEWYVLKKYVMDGQIGWSRLLHEVKLLKRLEHPNIASIVSVFLDNDDAYIQMPFYARGTLEAVCRDTTSSGLDEHQLQALMRETLRGVEHVHNHGVVHCDIKPANIFLAADGPDGGLQPKIGDFDVSKDNTERTLWAVTTATRSTVAGTVDYMAPELFKGQQATPASDVFSFGLVIFDLHFPRASSRPSGLSLSCNGNVSLPAHSNAALRDLLGQMLSVDPTRRPTATRALSHQYFTISLLVKQTDLSRQMADLHVQQLAAQELQRQLEAKRFQLEGESRLQSARLQQESNRMKRQEEELQGEIALEHKRLQRLDRSVTEKEQQQQAAFQAREKELAAQRARLAAEEQNVAKEAKRAQRELGELAQRERELKKTKTGLDKEKTLLLKSKILASPPPYWETRSLHLDQPRRMVEAADLLHEVQSVMTSTCISRHIGIGRDSHGLKHTGFKVLRVQRVENPVLWSKYQIEREAVRANLPLKGPSNATQLDCYSTALWKALQVLS